PTRRSSDLVILDTVGGFEGNGEPELAALVAFAGDGDLPLHQRHVLLADGKAEAGAAVFAGGGGVLLGEGIEDLALVLRLDTDAGVLDPEHQARPLPRGRGQEADGN